MNREAVITYNPGRQQPYTVWCGDHVWYFAADHELAMRLARQINERKVA